MLTILLVASPPDYQTTSYGPVVCLSVRLSLSAFNRNRRLSRALRRRHCRAAERRGVGPYGDTGNCPHQVLTEFQSLYPNDSQGFRLCPHQILRPSGGLVTGKLNFINFSVTLGLGFNFRWRSCRHLTRKRHKPLRRHLLVRTYFCNSGVLLPQP